MPRSNTLMQAYSKVLQSNLTRIKTRKNEANINRLFNSSLTKTRKKLAIIN